MSMRSMWLLCFVFFSFCVWLTDSRNTIRPNEILRENETLVSSGGVFELGFFPDIVSGKVFAGIWFKNIVIKKPVWVANPNNPLERSYASLLIRDDGNLIVIDRLQSPKILNDGMLATNPNTSATLLDTGNLILKQGDEIIWQSFNFPADTYLPGMKLGWFGLKTDHVRRQRLLSWTSPQNPYPGVFTLGTVKNESRRIAVWKSDTAHVDIGSLEENGFKFIFQDQFDSFNLSYISTPDETYLAFNTIGRYNMSWLVLTSMGRVDVYSLYKGSVSLVSHSLCNIPNAVNKSVCLDETLEKCKYSNKFKAINGSFPSSMVVNSYYTVDFDECELTCRSNCSCVAFALDEFGCQLYYGENGNLLNSTGKGGVVYVRSTATNQQKGGKKRRIRIILISSILPLIVAILVFWYCKRRCRVIRVGEQGYSCENREVKFSRDAKNATAVEIRTIDELEFSREDQHLEWFSINTIEKATGLFDTQNKLGEGGFGPVYKGKLPNGQEMAVKRLSKRSAQGVKELKNEVKLISSLQHRNLVRLLGCCVQGEENILVYEYMLNRSLDSFIFDESKQILLSWKRHVNIIEGIAQGLLYLHKYSRLRIIHRDLKTSNILLDGDMNPKISDFGMARIYGENETRAKTTKIAGTYGYMSPEYAMDGHYSEKSDVFSFGIIVLEIISSKRNIAFFETDHSLNLLGYAWKLFKEGRSVEFLDTTLAHSCSTDEAIQFVQLGLLCVQERVVDRPIMPDVVAMLRNDVAALPQPKEPAFLS